MSGGVGSPTSHFLLSSAQGPQAGSGLRLGALAWGPALPCLVKPPFPGVGGGQRLELRVRPAGNVATLCPSVLWNGEVVVLLGMSLKC